MDSALIIAVTLTWIGIVYANEDSYTHYQHSIGVGGVAATAQQTPGSGSQRANIKQRSPTRRKIKTTPKPRYHDYDLYDEDGDYVHGIVHPVAPPFDPTFRVIGGVRVPGIDTDIYGARKSGGERLDVDGWKTWERFEQHGSKLARPQSNQAAIMSPEDEIMHANDPHIIDDNTDEHTDAPCTLGCLNSEFLCARSCMCIPKHTRCDQEVNCKPYGEDEEQCTQTNHEIINNLKKECEASEHHVMCPKTFVCIAKEFLCDGDNDCGDYTDETHCGHRANCTGNQFECANGLCIPHEWVTDGDNDCVDGSDEVNATKHACTTDQFQCTDGNCVSAAFRCDGEPDCMDASDEENCLNKMIGCPSGEFKCRNPIALGSSTGNQCILNRLRCDGENDCGDWSDEEGCKASTLNCTSSEFKCVDGTCIPMHWKCDKDQDCDGGEDEKACTEAEKIERKQCTDEEFQCKDGRCLLKTWMCDGIPDCKSGDDETNCKIKCDQGQFVCALHKNTTSARICVSQKHVCDGIFDCPNGEDEDECPKPVKCTADSNCEQICVRTTTNQDACACRVGFILNENKYNCTDIDECQHTIDPVCSQKCMNTIGSYQCGCFNGYMLRPDLRTCKALGGAVKLILANRNDIRQVSLSNNRHTSIVKGLHNAIALDFHYKRNLLFWTDVSTDVIKMSYMNGTNVRNIIKWGLESPGGIAVDWIHDLIFWTDSGTKRVEVSTFDGSPRVVIVANHLSKPRAIVVHPGKALIFYTDWGSNPKIERAEMDGSDRRIVIENGIFWPNGLTIDFSTERLYWADAKLHSIESSDCDGNDRRKILSRHLPHPFAITVFEDQLYWTDWNTKSVSAANKVTGKDFRNVHIDLHFPMDIHSYHASRQPNFLNRCLPDRGLNGGCSHLCLPNKTGRRCACPIGLTLKDDQKTCTDVPNNLLMTARKKDIRVRQIAMKASTNVYDMVMPIDGLKSVLAIDFCAKTNTVFWVDVGRSTINRAQLNGANQTEIVHSSLASPAGLAYDWITEKLYWTDMGTQRIEVATIDGRQRTMLAWKNIDKPKDIVVNPIDGLMFWSDWGSKPKIERAGMDGSQRKTIVSESLQWPNGLAIDYDDQRLYFVDSGTKTIESIRFDGSNRRTVIDDNLPHPFSLDLYDQRVYFTDIRKLSVESANKYTGKGRQLLVANMSDTVDVRVFHRDRKSISNLCSLSNGHCSHLCLLNTNGYSCACPVGVLLSNDDKTCKQGPTDYIIFARRTDIRQISLDIDYMVDVVLPLPAMTSAMTVDVDVTNGDIYWADTATMNIMKSSIDGSDYHSIISGSLGSVDSLVIDSVGRKMYFTDSTRQSIEVSELNGTSRAALIYKNLEAPRGLAIDYRDGLLFWTDWSLSRIERAYMDGENRRTIVDRDIGWPNGLATFNHAIFWTDAKMTRIETCDYNGNNRRVILSNLGHPYGIAVTATDIYWTDWKTLSLNAVDRANFSSQRMIKQGLDGLMDVKLIEREKKLMDNACGTNNGNCSHLCLRTPSGFSCKCPTGTTLKNDHKCNLWPENSLLVAMRSGIGRISLDIDNMIDVQLPIDHINTVVVVDYHLNNSKIYYADVGMDVIRSVDMEDMKKTRDIVTTGLSTVNGLVVDWTADNLYWSDTVTRLIEVSRLDGSSRKVIINENLNDPRSLAIYPARGYLFFSDWGKPQRIERCFLDGSSCKSIVNSKLGFPTGLCVDFSSRLLYWADALEDRIELCDFDGRDRKQIVEHTAHPFGVALLDSNLYWSNWYNKTILKVHKRGRHQAQEFRTSLSGALDLRVVARSRQPNQWSPCTDNNGGCSHLCLYRYQTYRCECPDKPDQRHCHAADMEIAERPTNTPDYFEAVHDEDEGSESDYTKDHNSFARLVITATVIFSILLIIVVIAIIYLVMNNNSNARKTESEEQIEPSGSMLTFSNPNYNSSSSDGTYTQEPRSRIWKRVKYDKAKDSVFEEHYIGEIDHTDIHL